MNPPLPYRALQPHFGAITLPVPQGRFLPEHNLVAIDQNGQPVLASDTAGLTIAGVAATTVDARESTYMKVNCLRGIFRYPNSAASPVTAAELGKPVYVEDERTVAKSTSNSVIAGVALGIADAKNGPGHVWVCIGPIGTLPGTAALGHD